MSNLLATHQHKRRILTTTWLVFATDMQRYYVFISVNFTFLNIFIHTNVDQACPEAITITRGMVKASVSLYLLFLLLSHLNINVTRLLQLLAYCIGLFIG